LRTHRYLYTSPVTLATNNKTENYYNAIYMHASAIRPCTEYNYDRQTPLRISIVRGRHLHIIYKFIILYLSCIYCIIHLLRNIYTNTVTLLGRLKLWTVHLVIAQYRTGTTVAEPSQSAETPQALRITCVVIFFIHPINTVHRRIFPRTSPRHGVCCILLNTTRVVVI